MPGTPVEVGKDSRPPVAELPRRSWLARLVSRRHGGAWLTVGLILVASCLMRLALLAKAGGEAGWDASLLGAFAWGTAFDLGTALWWSLPVALLLAALPARFFERRVGRALAWLALFAGVYALGFTALAEWVFWDEFGVRFNFIAVDYLVYTTEVVGNIRESYPMPLLLGGLAVLSAGGVWLISRTGLIAAWLAHPAEPARRRWRAAAGWAVAAVLVGMALQQDRLPRFANAYNAELAKNGPWSFFAAFRANELDFDTFYPTENIDAAFSRVRRRLEGSPSAAAVATVAGTRDLLRPVVHAGPERRLNVIQITVESLSASFLTRYGNKEGITPNLDALMPSALVFDRFYATGNRTDRGMEALTLSVPPTPGRSLVKRPVNDGLFTLGSVFRSKGYATTFVYSGYGYFDNMNAFFGGNGYKVVDRAGVAKEDITFANAWGACDEDLYRWALREADAEYAAGRPFYQFVMTTSNHRPFTFPDGRIDLPSKTSRRAGGVKYTDYAIGQLLRQAATKPWFKDTIFVIVADHCASSAGKTELPVWNYHIPLIIYAPGGQVQPGVVSTLASQVDYAPTLLGLLGWSYPSRFFGVDVLAPDHPEGRALMGTYQKLGLYRGDKLAVIEPVRRSASYSYDRTTHAQLPIDPDPELMADAVAYYQTASWLFAHRVQRALESKGAGR
ncbi:LTA synthase family protein [Opitutus sp. ER46]|uniref:LTA synthase family protein n=1 Tax=Opitutus sp. ER46 TaxID=2161864 RepID=UPI001E3FB425|nr:LTA synthase family protein [Opitutus sp. ER46]